MRQERGHLNILYLGMLPPHPGGSAISGAMLIARFARLGHRVRAVAPLASGAARLPDAFAARHPEIEVTRYTVPHFLTAPFAPGLEPYLRRERDEILRWLPGLLERERPDLLFAGREPFAALVTEVAEAYALPCVLRTAGGMLHGLVSGHYPPDAAQAVFDQFRRLGAVIAPARYMTEALRTRGVERAETVLNAVDLEMFAPGLDRGKLRRRLEITDDAVVAMFVGNFNTRKRPLDFVESASLALREDRRLVYVAVGDGELREAMRAACARHGTADRFRFTGWVEYESMPEYFNLADVVVLPSEGEGLARVYLETYACGRVLVASDIAAAREVVEHGRTGLLFPAGDVEDLARQTLRAARDPRLRATIGDNARAYVQVHSLDRAVASYVETFRRVVQEHRTAPASAPRGC
jgi:glycosyltransferase involved in cell wall biosynthesis